MAPLLSSLNAHLHLQGAMTACSWRAGWRSLLLRAYDEPPGAEEFTTPPENDHLIAMVTGGSCNIEALHPGGEQRTHYVAGHIGMSAAGEAAAIRWRGVTPHSNLQLHLPEATLHGLMQSLSDRDTALLRLLSLLASADPLIEEAVLSLGAAVRAGAPDAYAKLAGKMLAAHLLPRYVGLAALRLPGREDRRLRREDFMRANLAAPLRRHWRRKPAPAVSISCACSAAPMARRRSSTWPGCGWERRSTGCGPVPSRSPGSPFCVSMKTARIFDRFPPGGWHLAQNLSQAAPRPWIGSGQ
jgi:AraC family transcriptional regulator